MDINMVVLIVHICPCIGESNRTAMKMNWNNQKPNPALKTKMEINKKYKKTKDIEIIWPTERKFFFRRQT